MLAQSQHRDSGSDLYGKLGQGILSTRAGGGACLQSWLSLDTAPSAGQSKEGSRVVEGGTMHRLEPKPEPYEMLRGYGQLDNNRVPVVAPHVEAGCVCGSWRHRRAVNHGIEMNLPVIGFALL